MSSIINKNKNRPIIGKPAGKFDQEGRLGQNTPTTPNSPNTKTAERFTTGRPSTPGTQLAGKSQTGEQNLKSERKQAGEVTERPPRDGEKHRAEEQENRVDRGADRERRAAAPASTVSNVESGRWEGDAVRGQKGPSELRGDRERQQDATRFGDARPSEGFGGAGRERDLEMGLGDAAPIADGRRNLDALGHPDEKFHGGPRGFASTAGNVESGEWRGQAVVGEHPIDTTSSSANEMRFGGDKREFDRMGGKPRAGEDREQRARRERSEREEQRDRDERQERPRLGEQRSLAGHDARPSRYEDQKHSLEGRLGKDRADQRRDGEQRHRESERRWEESGREGADRLSRLDRQERDRDADPYGPASSKQANASTASNVESGAWRGDAVLGERNASSVEADREQLSGVHGRAAERLSEQATRPGRASELSSERRAGAEQRPRDYEREFDEEANRKRAGERDHGQGDKRQRDQTDQRASGTQPRDYEREFDEEQRLQKEQGRERERERGQDRDMFDQGVRRSEREQREQRDMREMREQRESSTQPRDYEREFDEQQRRGQHGGIEGGMRDMSLGAGRSTQEASTVSNVESGRWRGDAVSGERSSAAVRRERDGLQAAHDHNSYGAPRLDEAHGTMRDASERQRIADRSAGERQRESGSGFDRQRESFDRQRDSSDRQGDSSFKRVGAEDRFTEAELRHGSASTAANEEDGIWRGQAVVGEHRPHHIGGTGARMEDRSRPAGDLFASREAHSMVDKRVHPADSGFSHGRAGGARDSDMQPGGFARDERRGGARGGEYGTEHHGSVAPSAEGRSDKLYEF